MKSQPPKTMAKIRSHLARAPITEALIDLNFRPRADITLSSVQHTAESLQHEYKQQGPIFELSTSWSVTKDDGPRTNSAARELGVRLVSSDNKYVLQLRTRGFTLSRLEPYETWDGLLTEARRLWAICTNSLEIESVVRVASRFINRLKLPMKAGEHFQEYLTRPPDVPDDLPQGVLGFMQRIVLLNPELGARANVIQLLQEGTAPPDHVPVIFDIDVYKEVELAPNAEDLWALLAQLRAFKNAIFFAGLTEKAVGLFE